ncbi:hypothetical protein BHYA_0306g00030 [Botrytis hyacinthi]|uniref:Rhodopsin domain-containing protein n=1 Tax=Botrytis hyacinthi TaxID=278943 RepID=A0A4Z1GAV1_9HELO|nr:hypothetical protein BHYA_0306g00030 [Botrytis hyacinthi]
MSQPDNFLDLPAMEPPAGEVQNLDNPPNGNNTVIGIYSVCIALASVFVVLRLYAKFVFTKTARVQDYLILPTFCIFIAHCVCWLRMNGTTGNLVHTWNFRIGAMGPFYKNGFYGLQFYSAVMLAIKPLILLEWIHIFGTAGRRFTWICYTLGTINVLTYFIAITVDSSACKPRAAWWDITIQGHCINTKNLPIATGTINAVVDVFILLLPQGIIWRLHMSRDKKIGVGLVFAVGLLSCGAALARMSLGYIYSDSEDVAYFFSQAGLFCVVEMTAAIIVFSAPTIPKPLGSFAKQATSSIGRLLRSFSGGSTYRTGAVDTKANAYVHIDEHGNAVPLAKLRSGKSGKSAKSGQTGQKRAESIETTSDSVV